MILVDTSVWIEFLRWKEPIATELDQLLNAAQVCTIEAIFGELLQGCKTRTEATRFLAYWRDVPRVPFPELLIAAGQYSADHRLASKGLALTDSAIIVAASFLECSIWSLDKTLVSHVPTATRYKSRSSPQNPHHPGQA